MILVYILISLINVFLHIVRSILVIRSGKFIASLANSICYTFSAIVIKFIAEVDLWIAICVKASTNFIGCWLAMYFCDWFVKRTKEYEFRTEN